MLNHKCKKVLNCLIYFQNHNIDIEGYKSFNGYLTKNILNKLNLILEYLSANGYLDYRCADDDIYEINLTYKGLDYKSFKFAEFQDFCFKSIFIPILISALTTIITMWLQHL